MPATQVRSTSEEVLLTRAWSQNLPQVETASYNQDAIRHVWVIHRRTVFGTKNASALAPIPNGVSHMLLMYWQH